MYHEQQLLRNAVSAATAYPQATVPSEPNARAAFVYEITVSPIHLFTFFYPDNGEIGYTTLLQAKAKFCVHCERHNCKKVD